MDLITRLCDPVIVMAEGRVLAQGKMAEIKADERVREAYLGAPRIRHGRRVTSLLEIEDLRAGYGDTVILHGVDIEAEPGELAVIIGPNGAGKSTLIKAIFGIVATHGGRVRFDGADITGAAPERLVAMGMAYVPQERNVFPTLTVAENLEMGAFSVRGPLAPLSRRNTRSFPSSGGGGASLSARCRAGSAKWSRSPAPS